jgi:endonuclease YncB( thermonuclease family)
MLTVILFAALAAGPPPLKLDKAEISRAPSYRVLNVPDGNSIVLKTGVRTARIRLLGVEAPEGIGGRAYDSLGAQFLQGLLQEQSVHLRIDSDSTGIKTPRAPAYVYRVLDGLLINREAIRQGYGRTAKGATFKLRDAFLVEERKAREDRRGLWAPDATPDYLLKLAERTKASEEEIKALRRNRWERRIRPLLIDNPRLECPYCQNMSGVNCRFCGGI